MSNKKGVNISWEDLQKMGNPANAPAEPEERKMGQNHFVSQSTIRVHLEKKGRGGKAVSIIRGLKMTDTMQKEIAKKLKSLCGVGGTQKNQEIIIQGDHRDKIIDYLKKLGATDIKKSGA